MSDGANKVTKIGAALILALGYRARGWAVLPIPLGKKEAGKGWPHLRLDDGQVREHFGGKEKNIGVLLGEPSHNLVDVDLDCDEARQLAPDFLPDTSQFGRASALRSHWLYECADLPKPRPPRKEYRETFKDPTATKENGKKAMLVELRGTGCQTVFPGSQHTSGEQIEWAGDEERSPTKITAEDLLRRLCHLSAASLLLRCWAGGARDEIALTFAGCLLRAGWSAEDANAFIGKVASAAGDEELRDRLKAERVETWEHKPGLTKLREVLGANVADRLTDWLGLNAQKHGPNEAWKDELVHNDKGKIIPDERNISAALRTAPELQGMLRFDRFAQEIQFAKPPPWRAVEAGEQWQDQDDAQLIIWLQSRSIPYSKINSARHCATVVAYDNAVHPVCEYLNGLAWDGTERLSTWLQHYLGADGPAAYLQAIARCFLVSAVARVFKPGCKVDHMLVFEHSQGKHKTMVVETLAVCDKWFNDDIGDVRSKDAPINLAGRWIVEVGELKAIRKAEVEATKAFISRRIDKYRPPYGRTSVEVPRQCVFIGTTNDDVYLKDQTGNRRFWPVKTGTIDLEALKRDRDQLWAEALQAFRADEQWWLTDEQEELAAVEQEERTTESEVERQVAEFIATKLQENAAMPTHIRPLRAITTEHVFAYLGFEKHSSSYPRETSYVATDVANALTRAGCKKYKKVGRGNNKRTIYMLPGVTELTAADLAATLKVHEL